MVELSGQFIKRTRGDNTQFHEITFKHMSVHSFRAVNFIWFEQHALKCENILKILFERFVYTVQFLKAICD